MNEVISTIISASKELNYTKNGYVTLTHDLQTYGLNVCIENIWKNHMDDLS